MIGENQSYVQHMLKAAMSHNLAAVDAASVLMVVHTIERPLGVLHQR